MSIHFLSSRMRKKIITLLVFSTLVLVLVNCTKGGLLAGLNGFTALPSQVPSPAANPQTPEKIALGRLLFWDPILSGNKDVACASCHHASLHYTDNLDLAIGSNGVGLGAQRHFSSPNDIAFTKRNTPTIVNVAFNGI